MDLQRRFALGNVALGVGMATLAVGTAVNGGPWLLVASNAVLAVSLEVLGGVHLAGVTEFEPGSAAAVIRFVSYLLPVCAVATAAAGVVLAVTSL